MYLGESEVGGCSNKLGAIEAKTKPTFARTNHRPLETATFSDSGQVFGVAPDMGAPGRCAAMPVAGHQRDSASVRSQLFFGVCGRRSS